MTLKLAQVGLAGFEDYFPAELSGGMRKRAGLARALALDPRIVFFDEPSAGLDPVTSRKLDELILQIRDTLGTTMVIVSHELASIYALADRVIMLDAGAHGIIAEGRPRELAAGQRGSAGARVPDPGRRESLDRRPKMNKLAPSACDRAGPGRVRLRPRRAIPERPAVKTRVNPAIVGLFVIGALVLGVLALLSFGGVNFFSKPQRFVVFFNESIHGLDLGSPVKLRGVRVGRVVDLSVRYDAAAQQIDGGGGVRVQPQHDHRRPGQADRRVRPRDAAERWWTTGLRAQLGVIGLATGLLFVELDFYDPNQVAVGDRRPDRCEAHRRCPAVPSDDLRVPGQAHRDPLGPEAGGFRRTVAQPQRAAGDREPEAAGRGHGAPDASTGSRRRTR